MPENAVPARVTVTGWLYQPLASGGRSGTAVADGLEVSTCNGKLMDAVPLGAHVTAHDTVAVDCPCTSDASAHPDVRRTAPGRHARSPSPGSCTRRRTASRPPVDRPGLHVTDSVSGARRRRRSRDRQHDARTPPDRPHPHAADPIVSRCSRLAIRISDRLTATSASSSSAPTSSSTPAVMTRRRARGGVTRGHRPRRPARPGGPPGWGGGRAQDDDVRASAGDAPSW